VILLTPRRGSPPQSQADHHAALGHKLAIRTPEVGGPAESAFPDKADMGRELAGEFVTQPLASPWTKRRRAIGRL
jgi:hypothetical protein|tara:strand:- start:21381 stop:21605 length:225 start_codon:yes stop_codon:yes gene_type:complete